MVEQTTVHLADVPVGGKEGLFWRRLHDEREQIVENIIEHSSNQTDHEEVLQLRLSSIDAALDRLMSGSFGICAICGRRIEAPLLETDPARTGCFNCSGPNGGDKIASEPAGPDVSLATLDPFDTVIVETHNSKYRIFILDPKTGRALIEGGKYLEEPAEGTVTGSDGRNDSFTRAAICVGNRLEMWIKGKVFLTSPIKTVKRNSAVESERNIESALLK